MDTPALIPSLSIYGNLSATASKMTPVTNTSTSQIYFNFDQNSVKAAVAAVAAVNAAATGQAPSQSASISQYDWIANNEVGNTSTNQSSPSMYSNQALATALSYNPLFNGGGGALSSFSIKSAQQKQQSNFFTFPNPTVLATADDSHASLGMSIQQSTASSSSTVAADSYNQSQLHFPFDSFNCKNTLNASSASQAAVAATAAAPSNKVASPGFQAPFPIIDAFTLNQLNQSSLSNPSLVQSLQLDEHANSSSRARSSINMVNTQLSGDQTVSDQIERRMRLQSNLGQSLFQQTAIKQQMYLSPQQLQQPHQQPQSSHFQLLPVSKFTQSSSQSSESSQQQQNLSSLSLIMGNQLSQERKKTLINLNLQIPMINNNSPAAGQQSSAISAASQIISSTPGNDAMKISNYLNSCYTNAGALNHNSLGTFTPSAFQAYPSRNESVGVFFNSQQNTLLQLQEQYALLTPAKTAVSTNSNNNNNNSNQFYFANSESTHLNTYENNRLQQQLYSNPESQSNTPGSHHQQQQQPQLQTHSQHSHQLSQFGQKQGVYSLAKQEDAANIQKDQQNLWNDDANIQAFGGGVSQQKKKSEQLNLKLDVSSTKVKEGVSNGVINSNNGKYAMEVNSLEPRSLQKVAQAEEEKEGGILSLLQKNRFNGMQQQQQNDMSQLQLSQVCTGGAPNNMLDAANMNLIIDFYQKANMEKKQLLFDFISSQQNEQKDDQSKQQSQKIIEYIITASTKRIGTLTLQQRIEKIQKYKDKRMRRANTSLVKYEKQQIAVSKKPRDKNGKFLKQLDEEVRIQKKIKKRIN